ncbi:MAG: nucleoside phosphorylase [Deltaproteobacteria bacterium]|nr:nucleoside phosphorylase [Deltaproteobacteria bacterium]
MDFFDPQAEGVIGARDMVRHLVLPRSSGDEVLELPPRAIVTFSSRMLDGLVRGCSARRCEAWRRRNPKLFLAGAGTERLVLTMSPYGSPAAAMLLEELIAFGVNRALFLGYCGSIQESLGLGDMVLPSLALREDGTSYHYLPRGVECRPDKELFLSLEQYLERRGVSIRAGPVWTTDALYRETRDKIEDYRTRGVLAVEMEMSALFAVASLRMIGVVALLLVSDLLSRDAWTPGFSDPRLLDRERLVNRIVLDWMGGKG